MRRLVVLEKVYGPHRPEDFTPAFLNLLSGLAVEVRVVGTAGRGWLVVELSGEDEEVAVRLIDREMGLAPIEPGGLGRFSVVRGRILSLAGDGLLVDIGVFRPVNVDARVGLEALRAQLADGLDISLEELARLFCLAENFPLEVRLLEAPSGGGPVEAELSEGQVRFFEDWASSGLDRLVVIGASHHAVKRAVGGLGLHDKIVELGRLGLLEHYITLKLGVRPREVLGPLRRRLRKATILLFRPGELMRAFPGRYGRLRF